MSTNVEVAGLRNSDSSEWILFWEENFEEEENSYLVRFYLEHELFARVEIGRRFREILF